MRKVPSFTDWAAAEKIDRQNHDTVGYVDSTYGIDPSNIDPIDPEDTEIQE